MNLFPFYYEGHESNYHIYLGAHLFLLMILHGTLTTRGIICARRSFFSANVIFNKSRLWHLASDAKRKGEISPSHGEAVRIVLQELW